MRLREIYAANVEVGDVIAAKVDTDAPTTPFQPMANALTVKSFRVFDYEGERLIQFEWEGLGPSGNSFAYPLSSKFVVIE